MRRLSLVVQTLTFAATFASMATAQAAAFATATSSAGDKVNASTGEGSEPIKTAIPKSKKGHKTSVSKIVPVTPAPEVQQAIPVSHEPKVEVSSTEIPEKTSTRDTTQSERYHQAKAQTFELTPGVSLVTVNTKIRSSDQGINIVGIPVMITGEYGFAPFFSIAVNFGYVGAVSSVSNCPSNSTCTTTSQYGMPDPQINFKFKFPAGPGLLRLGVNSHIAIEKSVTKSDGDSNASSGGAGASPFVSYEFPVGPGILGTEVEYGAYVGDRKVDYKGDSQTISEGADFSSSVYYEINHSIMTYGAALTYQTQNNSKTTSNGTTTTNSDFFNSFGLQLYAPVHFKSPITLFPIIGYSILTFPSKYSTSSANAFQVGASGRFVF